MSELYIAENILNKYYPTERTVFREGILKAMLEYCDVKNDLIKQVEIEEDAFQKRYTSIIAKQAIRIQELEEELSKLKSQ